MFIYNIENTLYRIENNDKLYKYKHNQKYINESKKFYNDFRQMTHLKLIINDNEIKHDSVLVIKM